MTTIKINEGGIWEYKNFEIETDFELEDGLEKCKHVSNNKLRAVVIAYNEGGFNTTGICVDCLIEALKENNLLT